ncbi:MAG: ATP-binding protein, partial [Phycisphaerales bacterium]
MQIPETPKSVDQLDLINRLKDYSDGRASWWPDKDELGEQGKQDCQILQANLVSFVNKMLGPLLSRINAREMDSFTMHDPTHSLKVAHLMWQILKPERRKTLTPPEIAILVISAFLHDLGMALSTDEREKRLDPDSDLWDRLELDEALKKSIQGLKDQLSDPDFPEAQKDRARHRLAQAEEALLCQDTRENHATRERYGELVGQLQEFHIEDPTNLPDVESCLSFAGDSFRDKLIEVCVSHGEDIDFLLENDETNIERPRFPRDYTVGSCTADLHMAAGALRLADILDFDRERTPSVLYHYLLPTNLAPQDDRSVLEWSKHLAISNWHIDQDAVVFRGRCESHIIHHAVVQFSSDVEKEIKSTTDTFSVRNSEIPFELPKNVQVSIEQRGYTYVPYKFELDDHRVYQLLMGGAIYDNPLVPARELVQNAVDACKLRDALTKLHDPGANPSTTDRITITYTEPTDNCNQPTLTVTDTGTGMDRWILENYFLKVGRSYYSSADFNKTRLQLRAKREDLDFAPVSEFGIGFLSCFLLADRLEVTTAMWEAVRGDTLKRTLIIDGPTRLIRLTEKKNEGLGRFTGTSVKLYLTRGSGPDKTCPPGWSQIAEYLKDICQDLPYRLTLEYTSSKGLVTEHIDAIPLKAVVPPEFEECSYRIHVDDNESGLEGEIALINPYLSRRREQSLAEAAGVIVSHAGEHTRGYKDYGGTLLRGGFNIGTILGLPVGTGLSFATGRGTLRLNWMSNGDQRYRMPNLARSSAADSHFLYMNVVRIWLDSLLSNAAQLPKGLISNTYLVSSSGAYEDFRSMVWLEKHDALTVYKLASQSWLIGIGHETGDALEKWERLEGEGGPLGSDMCSRLLHLVLPRITTLQLGVALYAKPPKEGWRQELEGW